MRYPCHGGWLLLRRYRWDVTTVVGTVRIPIDEGDHKAVSNNFNSSSLCVGLGDSVENPHPPHSIETAPPGPLTIRRNGRGKARHKKLSPAVEEQPNEP